MTETLRELFREHADAVEIPRTGVADIIARGESTLRRRRLGGVAAAAAAVAVLAGVGLFSAENSTRSEPANPPAPGPSGARPLTYAEGSTVHYGDESVDVAGAVMELDVTDDGVAVLTEDGTIWFTDGTGVDEIGTTRAMSDDEIWTEVASTQWVVSGNQGSRLAWFEYPDEEAPPHVVVYDSSVGEVVARTPVPIDPGRLAVLYAVHDDLAYIVLDPDEEDQIVFDVEPDLRLDVATGAQQRLVPGAYDDDLREQGADRMLAIGIEGEPASLRFDEGVHRNFQFLGDRLEPAGAQPLVANDARTGKHFAFRPPSDYPGGRSPLVFLTQWLDDDTVALLASVRAERVEYAGQGEDIFVCHIRAERCEVVVDGTGLSGSIVVPDLSTHASSAAYEQAP